jgi:phenylacetic acid degradation operon negative regulatory protein
MRAEQHAPTMSRRHAAGAGSARGLLFTVLGEFVLPAGGSTWTSSVIDVFARLGVEEKATRQALMRTAADGWLATRRSGRRTRWQLTPSARQLLTDGTRRIYGFAGTQADWDGRWLIVLARAPESERAARHLVRTRLTWAGLGSPGPGVWVSTHVERAAEVQSVLAEAGVVADAQIFVASHYGGGRADALVRQAWDLPAVDQRYREFVTAFGDATPVRDPLVAVIELVHAWRRFPWLDPELPAALLPEHWTGAAAAQLFARRHEAWTAAASAAWAELEGRDS